MLPPYDYPNAILIAIASSMLPEAPVAPAAPVDPVAPVAPFGPALLITQSFNVPEPPTVVTCTVTVVPEYAVI